MFDAVNRVRCPATVGTRSDVIVFEYVTIHDVTVSDTTVSHHKV